MSVRSTFTLAPEVVDLVAQRSAATLVLAAGGVTDGRGLAAALALGADGVLVGTRLWAAPEALVSPRAHERAIQASGDDTFRTQVYDVVRRLDWPAEYDARALGNSFLDTWHGNETQLSASLPTAVDTFEKAVAAEDFDTAAILVGEGVGVIRDIRPDFEPNRGDALSTGVTRPTSAATGSPIDPDTSRPHTCSCPAPGAPAESR
jgi:nitronate monooxygenase